MVEGDRIGCTDLGILANFQLRAYQNSVIMFICP